MNDWILMSGKGILSCNISACTDLSDLLNGHGLDILLFILYIAVGCYSPRLRMLDLHWDRAWLN